MYWFCAQMIYAGILVLCPFHQKSELLVDNHLKGLSSHSSLVLKNILKVFYIFWTWFYSVIWKPWDKNLSQEIMSFLCLCLTSLWKFPKRRSLVQKSGKILGETLSSFKVVHSSQLKILHTSRRPPAAANIQRKQKNTCIQQIMMLSLN